MNRSVLVLLSLILSVSGNAQQAVQGPEIPILQQFVTEVRQLRLALERTNSINSSIEATLQRSQLQQNRVSRISRQLESLRNEIGKSKA